MVVRSRLQVRSAPLGSVAVLALLAFLAAGQVLATRPALAQEEPAAPTESPSVAPTAEPAGGPPAGADECAVTGYLVSSRAELTALRAELVEQDVRRVDGVPLDRESVWVVPDGSQPVVVVDSAGESLPGGVVSVAVAGQQFEAAAEEFDQPRNRYVTNALLPHLGPTVRSLGLRVDSGPCAAAVALSVQRSVWSTVLGGAAVAVTLLFGLLTVLVARLRKGGWLRRFGFSAPLGLVAGLGQAGVLLEAGAVDPFAMFPWWAPVAGLAVAAVLPLTRFGRWRRPGGSDRTGRLTDRPPAQAPLGGYQVDAVVTRTDVAAVYRASRVRVDPVGTADPAGPAEPAAVSADDADRRALLKVALAGRFGEPAVRLRLEREAAALAGLVHPNLLRLRETIPATGPDGPAGPPTLVFEDVEGAPLRRLFEEGGSLSGPQAVSVVLEVLAGLQAVHAGGLVHRDVRPDNVWLSVEGRVLLGNLESAGAGLEHPVAPEGTEPYASPEQRAGRVLDARSDVWAAGVLLGELLTGQVPPAGQLPEPLADLLDRALAEQPQQRPASAEQFAAELRAAAGQVFGADWVGRGALAGALVAHGAIGAAAGGYALAGGATVAGAGGAGVAAGAAGAGTGAAVGTGVAGVSAVGTAAGTGTLGSAAVAAAAQTGPLGVVANAAVVVVAGVAIVAGAVLADPAPAQAQPVLITPEQARVIFIQTVDDARAERFTHLSELTRDGFERLLEEDDGIADGALTGVEVGVARDQRAYPLWFVGSALIRFEQGNASVFARFEREATDQPWLMTRFRWSTERLLPPPRLDGDGWLAPPPSAADLLVDPASLPERYTDWLTRVDESKEVGTDEVLALREDEAGLIFEYSHEQPFFAGDSDQVSYEYELTVDELETDLVPLADGTVQVTFTVTARHTTYNAPNRRTISCDQAGYYLFWADEDPPGRFRSLTEDLIAPVDAWVPVAGLVPEPAPAPTATPSPEPTADPDDEEEAEAEEEPAELALPPVDPTEVVIEDFIADFGNRDLSERC